MQEDCADKRDLCFMPKNFSEWYSFRVISVNESQNYYITFPKRSSVEGFECV